MAYYSHDTVSGPLSGAEGKEEVLVHEGKVLENEQIPDATKLEHKIRPTQSEEEVSVAVPRYPNHFLTYTLMS